VGRVPGLDEKSQSAFLSEHATAVRLALKEHGFQVNQTKYAEFIKQIGEIGHRLIVTDFFNRARPLLSSRDFKAAGAVDQSLFQRLMQSAGFGWLISSLLFEISTVDPHLEQDEVKRLGALVFAVIGAIDYLIDETESGRRIFHCIAPDGFLDFLNEEDLRGPELVGRADQDYRLKLVLGLLCEFAERGKALATRTGKMTSWARLGDAMQGLYAKEQYLTRASPSEAIDEARTRAKARAAQGPLTLEILWRVMTLIGVKSKSARLVARHLGQVFLLVDDIVDAAGDYLLGHPNTLLLLHELEFDPAPLDHRYRHSIDTIVRRLVSMTKKKVRGVTSENMGKIREFTALTVARSVA
jgi:hypothetical protein